MLTSLLATLREELHRKLRAAPGWVPRSLSFMPIVGKISVFIGMRRSGKTTFMLERIDSLLKAGIPSSQILYINFEDDRLISSDHQLLVNLVDTFYSLSPSNHDNTCHLFFDEIQNVPNWPRVIRRLLDSKNVLIYLTGSSSKLLSTEIATSLRGRAITYEIWPFSFSEYLLSQGLSIPSPPLGQMKTDLFSKNLRDYLHEGAFPELIHFPSAMKPQILQDYVQVVVMRDIIDRHRLSQVTLIRYLIQSLLKNNASRFSINKFFNDLKSQGVSASKNTLYDYMHYLEEAYLVFSVPVFSDSIRATQTQPKKIYAIDPGLSHAYTVQPSPNFGHLFENLVYLDLRRQHQEVFYYQSNRGYEVDFIAQDPQGKRQAIQVVWDASEPETLFREQRALQAVQEELDIPGILMTPEYYFTVCSRTKLIG